MLFDTNEHRDREFALTTLGSTISMILMLAALGGIGPRARLIHRSDDTRHEGQSRVRASHIIDTAKA
ncbi:MAG: hypothetical protein IPK44_02800 [Candidatus Accumulibacter sp.]|uniref:hypothetical protein n=1 Tax=Accumulibacter sp. TaxID=2053492 RepID=UPI002583CA48|nr:hypothetical protein [Accumulibacter sp.]MBK8113528.1 hypothetical protein [Accumulibacter sp.]